jgi:hypothetical protein
LEHAETLEGGSVASEFLALVQADSPEVALRAVSSVVKNVLML